MLQTKNPPPNGWGIFHSTGSDFQQAAQLHGPAALPATCRLRVRSSSTASSSRFVFSRPGQDRGRLFPRALRPAFQRKQPPDIQDVPLRPDGDEQPASLGVRVSLLDDLPDMFSKPQIQRFLRLIGPENDLDREAAPRRIERGKRPAAFPESQSPSEIPAVESELILIGVTFSNARYELIPGRLPWPDRPADLLGRRCMFLVGE
jgi:hypothetical protein